MQVCIILRPSTLCHLNPLSSENPITIDSAIRTTMSQPSGHGPLSHASSNDENRLPSQPLSNRQRDLSTHDSAMSDSTNAPVRLPGTSRICQQSVSQPANLRLATWHVPFCLSVCTGIDSAKCATSTRSQRTYSNNPATQLPGSTCGQPLSNCVPSHASKAGGLASVAPIRSECCCNDSP